MHKGLTNYIFWLVEAYLCKLSSLHFLHMHYDFNRFKMNSGDKVLLKSSPSFDMSIFETIWAFMNGGTLVIAKQGGQLNPYCIQRNNEKMDNEKKSNRERLRTK
jgi:hypothetical protein